MSAKPAPGMVPFDPLAIFIQEVSRTSPGHRREDIGLNQKVVVTVPSACVPNPNDFSDLATALVHQDKEALASLVAQGKVLLLNAGTRAEVLATGLSYSRTHIYVESGAYIGKSCDLLTQQIRAQ